jgi:hypothetical protein
MDARVRTIIDMMHRSMGGNVSVCRTVSLIGGLTDHRF